MSSINRTRKVKAWNKRSRDKKKHTSKNVEQSSSVVQSRISIGLFDKGTCSNKVSRESCSKKVIRARAEGNLAKILQKPYIKNDFTEQVDDVQTESNDIRKKRHEDSASPELTSKVLLGTSISNTLNPTPCSSTGRSDRTSPNEEFDKQSIPWEGFSSCIQESTKKAQQKFDNNLDLLKQARYIIQHNYKISRTPSTPPSTTKKVSSFLEKLQDSQEQYSRHSDPATFIDLEPPTEKTPPLRCPNTTIITPKRLLERYENKLSQEEFCGIFAPVAPQELPTRSKTSSTPRSKESQPKPPKTVLVNPIQYLERCETSEPKAESPEQAPRSTVSMQPYISSHVEKPSHHSRYFEAHETNRIPSTSNYRTMDEYHRLQQHYEEFARRWVPNVHQGYRYPPHPLPLEPYPLFPPEPIFRTYSRSHEPSQSYSRRNPENPHRGSIQYGPPSCSHYNWYQS